MPGKFLMPLSQELLRRALVRSGARSVFAPVGGLRTHYIDQPGRGDLPPVVLVHGLGASAVNWSRCIRRLAGSSRRVLALDVPGAGASPLPASGPLGTDGLFAHLRAFGEEVVGEPAVWIGNSLGGAMVARLASRLPGRVEAAVLVAPAGARVAPGRMEEVVRRFTPSTEADARQVMRSVFHRPPRLLPLLLGGGMLELLTRPNITRILREAAITEALAPEELRGLRAPVLLLWGRSEKLLPYEGIEYFRQHLPAAAEVREVEGFGHCPQLEDPSRLCQLVEDFLERRMAQREAA